MRKIEYILIFLFSFYNSYCQENNSPKWKPSDFSLTVGSCSLGNLLRIDANLGNFTLLNNTETRIYADISSQKIEFSNSKFEFNHVEYSSDARLICLSLGISQEFLLGKRWIINPLIGLRYYYVRFLDKDLVDAIGENGIIRYVDNYTTQVGPVVDNAYGDAIGLEGGCRIGIRIAKWIEAGMTFSYSPFSFSTAESLFGEYRGERPYHNDYYVHKAPLRIEGNIRIQFGG